MHDVFGLPGIGAGKEKSPGKKETVRHGNSDGYSKASVCDGQGN